jgi:negative regulator of sigma E activity
MNCNELEKLILLEDSGELTQRQQQELANHLPGCPTCRQQRHTLAALRHAMRVSPAFQTEPAPAVLDSIRIAAERHCRLSPISVSIPWRGIIAAAASVTICLASLLFLTREPAGSPLAKNRTATEIVPLVALVMGKDASPVNYTGESEMAVLADQLLILQGMQVDARDDLITDFTSLEDNRPTTLLWNSSCEPHPEKRG